MRRYHSGVLSLLCVGALSTAASAQISVPASSNPDLVELNSRTNFPFLRAESRSQYLIAPSELGFGATTLTRIRLRYDGPSVGASGGTLQNLDLYLGHGVTPAASSAYMNGNVVGGLVQVFGAQSFQYPADASTDAPAPWGGTGGSLTFVFTTPFVYTGGSLVVEIRANGNSNVGTAPPNNMLDLEEDPGTGPIGGTATGNGTGCNGATLAVSGQLAPGGEISCHGASLGAFAPVLNALGSSRTSFNGIPLPLPLDGMGAPGCSLYNNWVVLQVGVADGAGVIAPYSAATSWGVPADSAINGGTFQFQFVSVVPAANPLGVVTTNNVEVRLGNWVAPFRGYMAHFHHTDRNAPVAALSVPAVLAMQFN